jgi:hypothetical protein
MDLGLTYKNATYKQATFQHVRTMDVATSKVRRFYLHAIAYISLPKIPLVLRIIKEIML